MKSRLFHLCATVLCLSVSALAQGTPASPADGPASREDVLHLFKVMHIHEQMRTTMDVMRKQMRQVMHDAMKKRNPEMTEEQFSKSAEMQGDASTNLDIDGMLDDIVPVYQKHLTKPDIDAMIAFYATPTGQKLMREQPQMAAESMQAVSGRMQKSMDEAMQRIDKMSKDEAEKEKFTDKPSVKPEQQKN